MTRCAWSTALACAAAVGAVITCTAEPGTWQRVPSRSVVGRAALAVGDSGVFASPVQPHGVRHFLPHADAESAAVAFGYRQAPFVQDLTVPYYHNIPTERRRFCGRSYYVRSVLAMPDTFVVRSITLNDWWMWAPTWVMPICDDQGRVRSSVYFTDLPSGLRVIQGPLSRDVPELVPDSGTFPHIGQFPARLRSDSERGISLTPEAAVIVATSALAKTGARVTEVPEAFEKVELLGPSPPAIRSPRIVGEVASCPRWRLALDRPVALRGTVSGRVVHSWTVYVTRTRRGCVGAPQMQIPLPWQPTTVPLMYSVSTTRPGILVEKATDPEIRWATLRVVQPLWFEEVRPE